MTRFANSVLAVAAAITAGLSGITTVNASSMTPFEEPTRSIAVGGAVAFAPKYEGADDYDVTGFPLIFPKFGGNSVTRNLTIHGLDDVRYNVLPLLTGRTSAFELGPVAGYRFDREEDDGDLLAGLGDVDGGFIVGGFAGLRFGPIRFDAAYTQKVSGDDEGYLIRLGAGYSVPLSQRLKLFLRAGANYADDDYMQTYFGVTAAQEASSVAGLTAYTAEAGFKDVYLQLSARFDVTERITIMPRLRYSLLLGDAADSPVIETEDQLSGSLGVTYLFDF